MKHIITYLILVLFSLSVRGQADSIRLDSLVKEWNKRPRYLPANMPDAGGKGYVIYGQPATGYISYQLNDSAGPWLIWKKDSDTLELIRPLKVHYLKMGSKTIKL